MHSSRMRTGRSLTVCQSLLPGGVSAQGGCLFPAGGGVSVPRGVSALGGLLLWGCLLWGGCLLRGVSAPGGFVCSGGCLLQGGLSAPGECLLWGVSTLGVSAPGVSALRGRRCLLWGVVSQHALRQTPPCEQNDKQVQKYYLGHNFVAAGKNVKIANPMYYGKTRLRNYM